MREGTSRAAATRSHWLEILDRYMQDRDVPGSADYWSPRLRDGFTGRDNCHSGRQGRRCRAIPVREQRLLSPPV